MQVQFMDKNVRVWNMFLALVDRGNERGICSWSLWRKCEHGACSLPLWRKWSVGEFRPLRSAAVSLLLTTSRQWSHFAGDRLGVK